MLESVLHTSFCIPMLEISVHFDWLFTQMQMPSINNAWKIAFFHLLGTV